MYTGDVDETNRLGDEEKNFPERCQEEYKKIISRMSIIKI